MRFSHRIPEDLSPNEISRSQEGLDPADLIDLTCSNPTICGFSYPDRVLRSLADPRAGVYSPHPFGLKEARVEVANYLENNDLAADPENVILTSGTSEAYAYLFKLLMDPGEAVRVPVPGYPLFDHLARLEGVEALPYSLRPVFGWPLDRESLREGAGLRSKALIVVEPHNPTGCYLDPGDRETLWEHCRRHSLAYISDEVFGEYGIRDRGGVRPGKIDRDILSFRMGGLSKSLGLPQLKLSWMVLDGPPDQVSACKERLELIMDTYLTLATPVQWALKGLFAEAPGIQAQVRERVEANLRSLEQALGQGPGLKVWPSQGGWSAVLEVLGCPLGEERAVIGLMEERKVLVQPGGFFDMPREHFLVLSLLPPPEVFREGVGRIIDYFKGRSPQMNADERR